MPPTPRQTAYYGWRPDLPDQRDFRFVRPEAVELPSSIDLRSACPPVYDQGALGSCTANAIAAAIEFDQMKQSEATPFTPARLWVYYCERAIEGSIGTDSGAMIRDGVKACATTGYVPEGEWPYDITTFTSPPKGVDVLTAESAAHKVAEYRAVAQTLDDIKAALAAGFPTVFGFTVYESFESADVASSGNVPMPGPDEKVLGGHAVVLVGYDDATSRFTVRNSWGPGWGQAGYFTMPYEYVTDADLASDFWTLTTVNDTAATTSEADQAEPALVNA